MEKKITKKERYAQIIELVQGSGVENATDLVDFIEKEVALIDKKQEQAKANRAKKAAASDELKTVVLGAVTAEPQTIDAIVETVVAVEGYEEITRAKVVARLSALVKEEVIAKDTVKLEGMSGKKVVYSLV